MSRSGTLKDSVATADTDPHYGTGPVVYIGAGNPGDTPNEGVYALLRSASNAGQLRDSTPDWINLERDISITVTVVNSMNQTVTVEVEGFASGDLTNDLDWDLLDTLTAVADGGTDTGTYNVVSPVDYYKVRARYSYAIAPSAGVSANEEQTINLGDVATANVVSQGQYVDSPLTPDASNLPHQDFNSLPIGLRGSDIDAYRNSNTALTNYSHDEPFGNPARPSFTLTYNTHETARVYYDLNIASDIQAALEGLSDFVPGDVTVARTGAATYTVTFGGAYAGLNVSFITITNPWGFTPTGVTVTDQGGDTLNITWSTA